MDKIVKRPFFEFRKKTWLKFYVWFFLNLFIYAVLFFVLMIKEREIKILKSNILELRTVVIENYIFDDDKDEVLKRIDKMLDENGVHFGY